MHYGAAANTKAMFANRVTVVLHDKAEWVLFYGTAATNWDPAGHPKAVLDDVKVMKAQ